MERHLGSFPSRTVKIGGKRHVNSDGNIKHTKLIEYLMISGLVAKCGERRTWGDSSAALQPKSDAFRDSAAVESSAFTIRPNPPSFAGPSALARPTGERTEGRQSGILARSVMVPFRSSYTFLALTPERLARKRGLSKEKRRQMQILAMSRSLATCERVHFIFLGSPCQA